MLARQWSGWDWVHIRGRGGSNARLLLAWKAATRTEAGTTFLENALRRVVLGIVTEGLLIAGKLEVSFVEKVRLEAAAKQVCRSIAGRTIEAILGFLQS